MAESWYERARSVVQRVIRENPGLEPLELRKRIGAAYPFGERGMHPYKQWLKAVNAVLAAYRIQSPPSAAGARRKALEAPGQGTMQDELFG